jgi:hypothetical protein
MKEKWTQEQKEVYSFRSVKQQIRVEFVFQVQEKNMTKMMKGKERRVVERENRQSREQITSKAASFRVSYTFVPCMSSSFTAGFVIIPFSAKEEFLSQCVSFIPCSSILLMIKERT